MLFRVRRAKVDHSIGINALSGGTNISLMLTVTIRHCMIRSEKCYEQSDCVMESVIVLGVSLFSGLILLLHGFLSKFLVLAESYLLKPLP